jgi:hypothetical protein
MEGFDTWLAELEHLALQRGLTKLVRDPDHHRVSFESGMTALEELQTCLENGYVDPVMF